MNETTSDLAESFIKEGQSKQKRERAAAKFAAVMAPYYNALVKTGLPRSVCERLVEQYQAQALSMAKTQLPDRKKGGINKHE